MGEQNSTKSNAAEPALSFSKGNESRATILHTAAKLATTKGLHTLSIGDLAAAVGMSKSGLYAHFKSKEELELATIDTAIAIFDQEVLQHALAAPAGVQRLRAMVNAFLGHLERRVFPGGCFFASVAMELDTHPGPARDKVLAVQVQWFALLKDCLVEGRALGEINDKVDVPQSVFEIEAMMLTANYLYVQTHDPESLKRAKTGVENILARLGASPEVRKKVASRI